MRQTILTIVLVILIGATIFVWYNYARQSPSSQGTGVASSNALEDPQLQQYRQIENLTPDTSVLADPLFQALVSFEPAVPPVHATPGRPNPFVPF